MFNPSPEKLYPEIEHAERYRDIHLDATDALIQEYHGRHYRTDRCDYAPAPENHCLEWLSLVTSRIVYDNPVVKVSSRTSGAPKEVLVRMKHGINQWARMQELWKTLLHVWYDCAFSFGIIRTTLQDIPGFRGSEVEEGIVIKPQWPVCSRIDPRRFFIDSAGGSFSSARFMGHVWRRDKDDLLNAAGFNHDVIRDMPVDSGIEKLGEKNNAYNAPRRNEIVGREVWIPEIVLPEVEGMPGYHGTIFTIGVSQAGDEANPKWIRDPRPYYGPAWGPYTMFGIYHVPNMVYPLSPLAATHEQVMELNAHAVAISKSMAGYKKFVAFNPANPGAGKAVKDAMHGSVVPIDNLSEDIREIGVGGPDKVQVESYQFLLERRDRVTGLSEAARGNVTGKGSATEVADAATQRDARTALIERMFRSATVEVLDTAGWFLFNSEFARFRLGDQAANELRPRPRSLPPEEEADDIAAQIETGEIPDPGNLIALPFGDRVNIIRESLKWNPNVAFPHEDPQYAMQSMADISGMEYEDLQLMLEPMSMQRVDQALLQKRAQDQMALIANMAQIMPQTPWIRWQELIASMSEALNMSEFGEIVDMNILTQLQQLTLQNMMMQMGGMQQPQQGGQIEAGVRNGRGGPRAFASGQEETYTQNARMIGRNASAGVR